MSMALLRRWLDSLRGRTPQDAVAAPSRSRPVDLAATLTDEYSAEYPAAAQAVDRVLDVVRDADLSALARRSPGLRGYQWTTYLQCSVVRSVRIQRALAQHAAPGGRVLDYGSYFGNIAMAIAASGFSVDAVDNYREYDGALSGCVALQESRGIDVLDFADTGYDVKGRAGWYDAVVCAGVIEHIPHTPRPLLVSLTSLLKPGGVLVLETPNLAYLYRRLALLRGQSVYPPIAQQFHTELPFEGHHREYTMPEIEWISSPTRASRTIFRGSYCRGS